MSPFFESFGGMKQLHAVALFLAGYALLASMLLGCGDKGESGTTGVDCGEHGSAHGDHCHCEQGFLFDGATCVLPDDIDRICEAHADEAADAGAPVDGGQEAEAHDEHADQGHHEHEHEHEHEHGACRCPADGECHCDHGQIEEHGGVRYCVPELHAD